MNSNLIESAVQSPSEETIQALFNDEATVFWVDWKEEDDAIIEMCEDILQTGRLWAEVVEINTGGGYDITIHYGEKRVHVPLTYSMQDRHITLCSLNTALAPEWEIRFCMDSNGSDTLAFLPLSARQWEELEQRYSSAVARRFYKFSARPNLFTDSLSFKFFPARDCDLHKILKIQNIRQRFIFLRSRLEILVRSVLETKERRRIMDNNVR